MHHFNGLSLLAVLAISYWLINMNQGRGWFIGSAQNQKGLQK